MPDEFDLSSHINGDGTFNADGPGLAVLAGPDHAESQSFKDAKDFPAFVKAAFDTHAMVGKKMDNVIQKPADDASDADRAAYRKTLNSERGAPKTGAEYEFTRLEGLGYDDAKEAEFREFCCRLEVPRDTAKEMWDFYHNGIKSTAEANAKSEETATEDAEKKLREDWPGEAMIEKPRLAYLAINEFGPELFGDMWEDFKGPSGDMVKGLKTMLKETGVYDSPGDLAKWRQCGIDSEQLRHYEIIGRRMKVGKTLTSDAGGKIVSDMDEATKARINAENAGSPGMQIP